MKNSIRVLSVIGSVILAAGIGCFSPSAAFSGDRKEFDLGFLGKIVLQSEGNNTIEQPIETGAYKTEVSFSLQHELDDIRIPTLAKVDIKGSILEGNALARLEVTSEGVFLKGVPEYIGDYIDKNKQNNEFTKNGIDVQFSPEENNKIKFSKIVQVPPEKQFIFDEIKSLDETIRSYKQQIEISVSDSARVSELQRILDDAVDRKNNLFSQIFNNVGEFACAPEFSREFIFPIWGVGGSVEGGSASAAARAGVSGDVKIKIEPVCGISAASLFQSETWAKAKIDITSSGYFGAQASAQASGGYGMKFSGKYGDYFVPFGKIKLTKEEKQFFNDLVLKMMKQAEDSEQALVAFTNKISRSTEEITGEIQKELISRLQNQEQICSFLLHVSGANSEAGRICQALASPLSPLPPLVIPPLVLPPMPPLPPRPDGQCRAQLPLPPCRVECVYGVCEHCRRVGVGRFSREICVPVPCTTCSNQEIPPHCGEARRATEATNAEYRRICERIRSWEQQVANLRAQGNEAIARTQRQWEENRERITAQYNQRRAEYDRQVAQRAEDGRRLPGMAQDAVTNVILRQVDTKDVAQKLLKAAWQVKDWVDLTSNFITDRLPQNLNFNIHGSASVSFNSTAHILHVTPKIRAVSSFSPQRDDLSITIYGVADERTGGDRGIGGLDILDYALSAKLRGSFAGREFNFGTTETGKILPFFDERRIQLSNEEKQLYQWHKQQ